MLHLCHCRRTLEAEPRQAGTAVGDTGAKQTWKFRQIQNTTDVYNKISFFFSLEIIKLLSRQEGLQTCLIPFVVSVFTE